MRLLFDGHLDIAYNALSNERDPLSAVEAIRAREAEAACDDGRGACTTSLRAMREAGVAVALTTLLARAKAWVKPGREAARMAGDWPTPEMAFAVAHGQLAYYRLLEAQGHVRLLDTAEALAEHWAQWEAAAADPGSPAPPANAPPVGLILTMECADPIVEPDQLHDWHALGLRTLLLTHFGQGRYAAGNPSDDPANTHDVDGPLTPRGIALLETMNELRMPLDLTHLSDTSFFEAIERYDGPVYSSHTNCRALAGGQRQFSDDMIRAIAQRGGVLGLATHFGMIRPGWREVYARRPIVHQVTMNHLADHVDHIAQLTGEATHAALGSDLDGGFGREECPNGLDQHCDLHRLGEILSSRGHSDAEVAAVMHRNWLSFFGRTLPSTAR